MGDKCIWEMSVYGRYVYTGDECIWDISVYGR